ncbi:MAG: response regulator transcription factor [Sinobacteraceae bacterium]|nr:response regulator transcription factor [Nevskiaceae bacterium]
MLTESNPSSARGAEEPKNRLVVVEDHAILREGLRALLELEPDLKIVGEATNGIEALPIVQMAGPDMVITDVALPGRSGIELIAALRQMQPQLKTLVLTAHNSEEYIRAALNAGAHGYVLKDASRIELLQAVRTVLGGQTYLSASVTAQVVSGYLRPKTEKLSLASAELVTEREREVLTRVALGRSNKLIARELDLSVKTVEKHRANLMRKLTLHNTAAVTRFAIRNGMVNAADLESTPTE